ncbi:hypothetical protein J3E74DRAFT_469989 [Bipolaris maydis]|nr:hypothetical protein J3E74DRAFT_469989 [Bipolaris maydis]
MQSSKEIQDGKSLAIEKELQQERKASELFKKKKGNQQFIELQECHDKLLKEYESCVKVQEDLNRSATDSRTFADEVARRAESLLNNSRASLAGGDVEGSHNGQSISEMILESAKNALLVQAISSQHSEDDELPIEDGKNEVASLNKALEIATEDGRRKKSRRGKTSAGKKQ